jgi:hypothetical protein
VASGKRRAGVGVNFGAVEKQKKRFDVFSSFSRVLEESRGSIFCPRLFLFLFWVNAKKDRRETGLPSYIPKNYG